MSTQPDLHEAEKEEVLKLEEEEAGVDEEMKLLSEAAYIVNQLSAQEVNSLLKEAYEKYPDVRDAVNNAFIRKNRIFIHNVPVTAHPMDLYDRFLSFGEIVDTKIFASLTTATGLTACVGCIVFEKYESAEKAANFPGQSASFLGSNIQWHARLEGCSHCEQVLSGDCLVGEF